MEEKMKKINEELEIFAEEFNKYELQVQQSLYVTSPDVPQPGINQAQPKKEVEIKANPVNQINSGSDNKPNKKPVPPKKAPAGGKNSKENCKIF